MFGATLTPADGVSGASEPFTLPEDFNNWDIPVNFLRTGPRSFEVIETVDNFMPVTNSTYYVDSVNGNNANSGLTLALAKQSIDSALTAAGATIPRVLISPGQYALTFTKSCVLEGNGGNWSLTASRQNTTAGITVGFKNFTANFRLTCGGASTYVFDTPTLVSASSSAIRGEGSAKMIIYDAVGTGCTNDGLSYAGSAMALEVACDIQDNGTISSDNASTGHENSRIVTVGAMYTDSFRVVHDINAVKRVMLGGIVNTSKDVSGDPANSFNIGAGFSGTSTVETWLFGVDARGGSEVDLYVNTGCTMHVDDKTLYSTVEGSVTPYL